MATKMSMKKALAAFEKTPLDKAQAKKGGPGYEGSAKDKKEDAAGARALMKKAKKK